MSFNFNDYVKRHRTPEMCKARIVMPILPHIKCADGFKMSVQAGEYNYCSPRENTLEYESVEVGFPSEMVPELMEYAEDPTTPTQTVYGWVPAVLIESIVEAHGGLAAR